jgi:signal transduction histidine kinase
MTKTFEFPTRATGRQWRFLLVAMLVLLHLAAMRGTEDVWARGMMMAHLGLFFIWQPFMQGGQRLKVSEVILISLITIAILVFLSWWMLGLWVGLLAGVIGGKVFLFQARWLRVFYLTTFFYLASLLLVWVVPNGFATGALPSEVRFIVQYGLPILFLIMVALPVESDTAEPQIVDFLYASFIFLLLTALVLGSFAYMTILKTSYPRALSYSLLSIAAVLIFLSVAWNPGAGFAGLATLFSRYLLSIGLPFEQWLHFLAELSRTESRPDQFLKDACAGLGALPWVTGGAWHTSSEAGEFGSSSKHSVEFADRELTIRLYSRHHPSPSLVWHFHLLGQLLGQFYVAKQREQKLKQQTYVQALHEAGARLTHDVKNLLQSLNVLCSAVERDPDGDPEGLQMLIRRHLPTVTQRLRHTIDKLQRPQVETGRFVRADAWWEGVQKAYQIRGVDFQLGTLAEGILLPKDLFDGAADNMIQNALEKRKLDPGVQVRVTFDIVDSVSLTVCDSGRPVAREVLAGLLRGPVPSDSGYGIGLYQVGRQAELLGFSFRIAANEQGNVCFELAGDLGRGTSRQPTAPVAADAN